MTKFEEMGRKLDRELERLREIAEKKISPATRVKAAKALRGISATLARLAVARPLATRYPQRRRIHHVK